jgi:hypothetical protein
MKKLAAVVALLAGFGYVAFKVRWRLRVALNVLMGRPTMYRVRCGPIVFAPGIRNLLAIDNFTDLRLVPGAFEEKVAL